ncbi:Calcineurin B-like protein [Rhynchospora pubera]|uniref:Calcineurin B-like protein n=1 Tax=Rhynchospora pubera TaxID=906938 RepID=A0AAV8DPS5_9POAL|nr:Calcineurin B-like protein [Rhynchospora pubera]
MGCVQTKNAKNKPRFDLRILASETNFTLNEVEALYELFKKLRPSMSKEGFVHKRDFQQALVKNSKHNLFADRLFDLFDERKKGVIEFSQFVWSLSVFHPNASEEDKISCAFKLYDLNCTGFIERDELKRMLIALSDELDLNFMDDVVESILNVTFTGVDLNGDGKIDKEEWVEFAKKSPYLLQNMTIPNLKEITMAFPSFVVNTEVDEADIVIGNTMQ